MAGSYQFAAVAIDWLNAGQRFRRRKSQAQCKRPVEAAFCVDADIPKLTSLLSSFEGMLGHAARGSCRRRASSTVV